MRTRARISRSVLERLASDRVASILALQIEPFGPPPVSADVGRPIRRMAAENLTWDKSGFTDELWLKLQIRLSQRTVRKYIEQAPLPHGRKPSGPSPLQVSAPRSA